MTAASPINSGKGYGEADKKKLTKVLSTKLSIKDY
jgi:hypothetical protein